MNSALNYFSSKLSGYSSNVYSISASGKTSGIGANDQVILNLPSSSIVDCRSLRIAFNLRADDVVTLLAAGGQKMSKSELTALFRKPNHKNFRACGNQVLRTFMVGLEQSLHRKSPGPG